MNDTFQPQGRTGRRAPYKSDPIGRKLSWSPVRGGGATFKTAEVFLRDDVVKVRASMGMAWFFLAPAFAAALLIGGGLLMFSSTGSNEGSWVMLGIGTVFALLAGLSLWLQKPITFDKSIGMYYRGRRVDAAGDRTRQGPLSDIRALQVLTEVVRTSDESSDESSEGSSSRVSEFASVEINLVCQDGTRLNVLDHGDRAAIDQALEILASYLDVPVWER